MRRLRHSGRQGSLLGAGLWQPATYGRYSCLVTAAFQCIATPSFDMCSLFRLRTSTSTFVINSKYTSNDPDFQSSVEIYDSWHVFHKYINSRLPNRQPIIVLAEGTSASSFTTNCTIPPEPTNYVAGPNVRSTLSILWNCLSIILLCTWSVLHLNVPARRPPASIPIKMWWAIWDSRKKAKWMMLAIPIPEYLVGKALDEFSVARSDSHPELSQKAIDAGTEWGSAHTYFANMGGVRTRLH